MKLLTESKSQKIKVESDENKKIIDRLAKRADTEGKRLTRFLELPDLSRMPGSPLSELVSRILKIENLANFDQIEVPEIVKANVSFDLFNFPADHPARNRSDTYYVDDSHILRTHTTIMWYYYLTLEKVKEKIAKGLPVGVLAYGKVYRKDEIDRHHMNVFHQMDGLYLCPREQKVISQGDLEIVLKEIARSIYGPAIKCRFNVDNFPYTQPSIEMEIEKEGNWIEVLGGGLVRAKVLENLGVDPGKYNGWAFGFGLERLAIVSMELPDIRLLRSDDSRIKKQLHLGSKFVPVSKYPPIARDVSFVVDKDFVPNNYFDLIRDIGGDLVEEVRLLDKYESQEKFGSGKISYTYHIVYRSNDRTLLSSEIDPIQEKIYKQTAAQFGADLR